MWGGATTTIPTGWQLCDGTNSTPDLRSKFIVGASASGGYAVATTGGSADAVVVSHNHTASSSVTDPGHFHTSNWYNINDYNQGSLSPGAEQYPDDQQGNFNKDTDTKTTGITVSTTVSSSGVSATNANLPPYYALCYIQKMF
jgi:microcystin-dependent protein